MFARINAAIGKVLFLGGLLAMPYLLHLIGTYAVAVKGGATATAAFTKAAGTHLGFFTTGTIYEGAALVGTGVVNVAGAAAGGVKAAALAIA